MICSTDLGLQHKKELWTALAKVHDDFAILCKLFRMILFYSELDSVRLSYPALKSSLTFSIKKCCVFWHEIRNYVTDFQTLHSELWSVGVEYVKFNHDWIFEPLLA